MVAGSFACGVGALVYLVAFLQPWFETPAGVAPPQVSRGQDAFLFGFVPLVLLVAVAVVVFLPVAAPWAQAPPRLGPVGGPASAAVCALAAAFLVILRLVLPVEPAPDGSPSPLEPTAWLAVAGVGASIAAVGAVAVALLGEPSRSRPDPRT